MSHLSVLPFHSPLLRETQLLSSPLPKDMLKLGRSLTVTIRIVEPHCPQTIGSQRGQTPLRGGWFRWERSLPPLHPSPAVFFFEDHHTLAWEFLDRAIGRKPKKPKAPPTPLAALLRAPPPAAGPESSFSLSLSLGQKSKARAPRKSLV